jgi:hypothetical protein
MGMKLVVALACRPGGLDARPDAPPADGRPGLLPRLGDQDGGFRIIGEINFGTDQAGARGEHEGMEQAGGGQAKGRMHV